MLLHYTMDLIPEHLRRTMTVDAIVLKKKTMGWGKIHYNIRVSSLYLKKTYTRYIPSDMMYENILRANTSVYFVNGKTFTWLRQFKHNPNMYYYAPRWFCSEVQDIFSMNEYGEYLDDEYMDDQTVMW